MAAGRSQKSKLARSASEGVAAGDCPKFLGTKNGTVPLESRVRCGREYSTQRREGAKNHKEVQGALPRAPALVLGLSIRRQSQAKKVAFFSRCQLRIILMALWRVSYLFLGSKPMKFLMLGLVGTITGFVLLTSPVDAQAPGSKQKIAVDDPGVIEAAAFALEAQKKAANDDSLILAKIEKAERQTVLGFSYTLLLNVKSGEKSRNAVAIVWVKPLLKDEKEEDRFQLTLWKWK